METSYKSNIQKAGSLPGSLFLSAQERYGLYTGSGMQLFQKNGQYCFAFVNFRGDSLIVIPLGTNDTIIPIGMAGMFRPKNTNEFLITNDTLHIYNTDTHQYSQIAMNNDWSMSLINQQNLGKYIPADAAMNSNSLIDKKIAYNYPYLLLPYLTTTKHNYAGKNAVLKINLQLGTSQQIVGFPEDYRQCDYLWIEPMIMTDGNDIITAFPSSDEITIHDISTGQRKKINHNDQFDNSLTCYDTKLAENLSYDEKYQGSAEKNMNILRTDSFYYLVKRLKKKSLQSPTQTAVLVFDQSLKHIGTKIMAEEVAPRISFIYDGQLAIYSYAAKCFYLYDI